MKSISQDFMMKKKILLSILLTVLLLSPAINASAGYYEPVSTQIALEISNGGTATIIPEVNCPVPDKAEIELKDGHLGKFNIYFDEVGVYTYTVKTKPDERENMVFDKRVYTVKIYINDEGGELVPTVIAYTDGEKYSSRGGSDYGPERLMFSNVFRDDENPSEKTTTEKTTKSDNTPTNRKSRNPKTGDDTRMELYFVIAMIASAGLLVLSVIYLIDTEKMLKKKENE